MFRLGEMALGPFALFPDVEESKVIAGIHSLFHIVKTDFPDMASGLFHQVQKTLTMLHDRSFWGYFASPSQS